MTLYEIPLKPNPQEFQVVLGDGNRYGFRTTYVDAIDGGWLLDISDPQGNPLISGIPLVTGANLLDQYAYVGIPGILWVASDGDPAAPPAFQNLGITSHLYYEA